MKKLTKYLVTFAVGLLIALLVAIYRGAFEAEEAKQVVRYLCDAFFVATICVGGLGALVFVSSEGAFDMLAYGLRSFFSLFKGTGKRKYDSYYDYKQSKAKNKMESGFMLYVGLFFLLVTIVLYIVFYNI